MIVNRRYADAATGRPRRSRSNGGWADVGAAGPVRDLSDDGFSDRRAAKAAESSEKETDLNPADRALDYFSLESPIDSDRDCYRAPLNANGTAIRRMRSGEETAVVKFSDGGLPDGQKVVV